ncbi:MAG: DUF5678 domain-containing protein [archaeon]
MVEEVSIVHMLQKNHRTNEWYNSSVDSLKRKFNNEFIAIENESVIEHAEDMKTLFAKLRSQGLDPSGMVIKFVSKMKAILSK